MKTDLEEFEKVSNSVIQEIMELRERVDVLKKGIEAVEELIKYSTGITGFHENGDNTPWYKFRVGGTLSEWLKDFDYAIAEIRRSK